MPQFVMSSSGLSGPLREVVLAATGAVGERFATPSGGPVPAGAGGHAGGVRDPPGPGRGAGLVRGQ
ncbi:hypothetical protein [Protofrankia symbiont of Coriaria ruscifolia]|uniref:hypothetical protein n=1 Tax=Protofrankia symbiont of Coriaria ruscifolia TaxID=1306542 RepID=UPI0010419284|nr:hypothetical protein [Protofrankia symbiont of Coriaria ruscifolia]